jgi:transcriptional repressor NF-X1
MLPFRTMDCGFHTCERLCHADACGSCTAVCGKDRKLWSVISSSIKIVVLMVRLSLPNQHPCTAPCHAPSACDESTPCRAIVTISCPCGRIQKPVPCLVSSSVSTPVTAQSSTSTTTSREIKCTNDCQIAARNARLADALGISAETRERAEKGGMLATVAKEVEWSAELRAFGKSNSRFVEIVEKALAE